MEFETNETHWMALPFAERLTEDFIKTHKNTPTSIGGEMNCGKMLAFCKYKVYT